MYYFQKNFDFGNSHGVSFQSINLRFPDLVRTPAVLAPEFISNRYVARFQISVDFYKSPLQVGYPLLIIATHRDSTQAASAVPQ